ncbi:hypothetical protein GSI_12741 [Ganoderma sinense ZZ0214-1]|uniref:Uncharacterized protein n=1 Tax=Ganoderma sinense ZZ0214-1 TaxID=1077348 RepID=A0A2G8RTL2_9APHY|nr:hypothetical protein GSI_12741 [Ganoderma sinense ZZ0214-1]
MPWVHNLYDAEDGVPTLQSEMQLSDDPDLFGDTLANIREIWRQHGVDRNVAYKNQVQETTMATVKRRALNEMPFLRKKYHKGWPVRFYLQRSLQHRITVAAQRKLDEAPYIYRGRPFMVVDPNHLKDKLRTRRASHERVCAAKLEDKHLRSKIARDPLICRRRVVSSHAIEA